MTFAARRRLWQGLGALLLLVLGGGCGDGREGTSPEPVPAESLPGVYSGVFPCDGCPGMPTRLWLRADGRFFFSQQYPQEEGRDGAVVYALGRWNRGDERRLVHLDGSGPRRTFARLDADTLVMQTPSDLEHRLTRDRTAAGFTGTIRLTGTVRPAGDGLTFTECLTGFVMPLSRDGDFSRFHHQYRSAGDRRGPTQVELEGRFSWSGDGAPRALTIERFITVRAGEGCP